jgi:DNA modification methylase/ParB-like chromosome segregation protein Spo0J
MKPYAPDEIQISPDRQRQEFDPQALEELKSSIEGKRLQHAPVVRETPEGPVLVAGERRVRVIRDIFALGGHFYFDGVRYTETIPTVTLGELDPLEAEEAELDENLRRKDLTWQELAAAHERLHKLRQAQQEHALQEAIDSGKLHGDASEVAAQFPKHTVADTAKEIHGRSDGYFQDSVRKELIVAKHLSNPEVAKAKSVEEAFKILKRSEQQEQNRELALKVGATFTAEKHRVFHDSCLRWMDEAIDRGEQFDVILTDPPYGMGAESFGDGGGKLQGIDHKYDDSYYSWVTLMSSWAPFTFQIAKPQAHLYAFCDIDNFHELKRLLQDAGWYVFRTPLIDYKTDSGRVPLPDRGPRRQWEMILYAIKGDKPVTHIYPDVIPCQADEQMGHGAQKPVALYVNLLKRSVRPGDKVLDTFAGSGTIIPACHQLQCEATAIEQEAASYGMCLKRLQQLKEAADPLAGLA